MAKITDEAFNKTARESLVRSDKLGSPLSRQFCQRGRLIRLYDGNGDYVYDFYLKDGVIKYKLTSEYAMDAATKRRVRFLLFKDRILLAVAGIGIVGIIGTGWVCGMISLVNDEKNTNSADKTTDTIDDKTVQFQNVPKPFRDAPQKVH